MEAAMLELLNKVPNGPFLRDPSSCGGVDGTTCGARYDASLVAVEVGGRVVSNMV
jgi:hypothetical protein